MMLLQGAQYLHHSQILGDLNSHNILFSSVFMLYMNRIRKGNFRGFCQCYKLDLGALLGYNVDKVYPLCFKYVSNTFIMP